MIYFKSLTSLSVDQKIKFIQWKKDEKLSELIMSEARKMTIEDIDSWILKNTNDRNQFFKCVCRSSDDEIIGLARLMYIDYDSKNAEVGLYIGNENDRNKNLGYEIISKLIDTARTDFKLNKIIAKINELNHASIKLFLKHDFIKEGNLKKHFYSSVNDNYFDVFIYSKFL